MNQSPQPEPREADQACLNGKVLKWTLPVVEPGSNRPMPQLKRLRLPQGELAQLYDGPEGIQYIALMELRAGAVRGNHYHNVKQEWFYVCQGEVLLKVADPTSRLAESIVVRPGDLVFIPPGIAHSMHTVQPGHALEFAQVPFNSSDSQPFPLD